MYIYIGFFQDTSWWNLLNFATHHFPHILFLPSTTDLIITRLSYWIVTLPTPWQVFSTWLIIPISTRSSSFGIPYLCFHGRNQKTPPPLPVPLAHLPIQPHLPHNHLLSTFHPTMGRTTVKTMRRELDHSLIRSLVRSHRLPVRLLRTARLARALRCAHSFARSLPRSWERGLSLYSIYWMYFFHTVSSLSAARRKGG